MGSGRHTGQQINQTEVAVPSDIRMENNSWEPQENVHAPDIVADFYRKHLGAARHIQLTEFFSLPFQPTMILKGGWMLEDTTV